MIYENDAEVRMIDKRANGNPIRRKSGLDIKKELDSVNQIKRNHAYCQPNFCAFFNRHVNCDHSPRAGEDPRESHIVWINRTRTRKAND